MRPILDRVIIKQDEQIDKTRGGIMLAKGMQSPRGKIVAVGPSAKDVSVDDYVLFNVNYHQKFTDEGVEYITISYKDVLAIIPQSEHVTMDKVS